MARRTFYSTLLFGSSAYKPKPTDTVTTETETSESFTQGSIPQAVIGVPVPAIIGRKRVPDNNVIWTGNLRPLTEVGTQQTETEETDENGLTVTKVVTVTTTTIVGYLCDIHLGVCLGPDVHLLAIYVDNQQIWSGDIGPNRTVVSVGENNTFLSDSTVVFSGGNYDQAPEPDIDVEDYPGYVGVATVLLKDVRVDLPMGNMSFEVSRVPNPLSLSSGTNVTSERDVNVVSALAEVMTNEWGYAGLELSDLDTVKLSSMATELASESNYCSIKIGSETSVASLIKALQAQALMVVFQSPETGKITGQLVRTENIDYVNGRRFYPANIKEMRNYGKGWWTDTAEQVRGLYTERDADYNEVPVFVQNYANIPSGRNKRTVTYQYPFVSNAELTQSLLVRDMSFVSSPAYGFELVVDRDGALALPGDIVIVSWPNFNLLNVPMLVNKVRKQERSYNTVVLSLSYIKLPETTPLFNPASGGVDPGFDLSPKTPVAVTIMTAPYHFVRSRRGVTTKQTAPIVYPMVFPTPTDDFQYTFNAYVENVPGAVSDVTVVDSGLYPTVGLLAGAISQYDGYSTGIVPSINVDNIVNPVNMSSPGNSGVRDGRVFMIVDDEIMSFEVATDNGDGSWTLTNVHRGLLDTVPAAHADNAKCFIIPNSYSFIGTAFSYPLGYTPDWNIVSRTLLESDVKSDGISSTGWAPSSVRTLAPPRPHNTEVNGSRTETPIPVTEGVDVTVSWTPRSRINTQVALQLDSADALESGQTFNVYHRSSGGTLTLLGSTAGSSLTVSMPNVSNGIGSIFVESKITLAGVDYTSIQQDRVPVTVS